MLAHRGVQLARHLALGHASDIPHGMVPRPRQAATRQARPHLGAPAHPEEITEVEARREAPENTHAPEGAGHGPEGAELPRAAHRRPPEGLARLVQVVLFAPCARLLLGAGAGERLLELRISEVGLVA